MKGSQLGELEELVMLIVGVQHPLAYGVSIRKQIWKDTGRKMTLSSIHAVLQRLERKGFLVGEFGETTPERGGKRKKYFTITKEGAAKLSKSVETRRNLWRQIPKAALAGQ